MIGQLLTLQPHPIVHAGKSKYMYIYQQHLYNLGTWARLDMLLKLL